jgi:anti-anti-sigma regulatory factor
MAERKPRRRSLVLEVDGIFDRAAASRIERVLSGAHRASSIHVDLSRVVEFEDLGLATLADALRSPGCQHVSVMGLRNHQVRLLRYLGVPVTRRVERELSPERDDMLAPSSDG